MQANSRWNVKYHNSYNDNIINDVQISLVNLI